MSGIRIYLILLFVLKNFSSSAQTDTQKAFERARLRLERPGLAVHDFDTISGIASYWDSKDKQPRLGFMDSTGKEFKVQFNGRVRSVGSFINGYGLFSTLANNKSTWYLIDTKGKVVTRLAGVEGFRDWTNPDRIIVSDESGRHGVMNRRGVMRIPFSYGLLMPVDTSFMIAYNDAKPRRKAGVINNRNKIIIPFEWDQIFYYNNPAKYVLGTKGNDFIAVKSGKEYRIRNAFKYVPSMWNNQVDYKNGLILETVNDSDVLYTTTLDTVQRITFKYEDIEFISEGLIGVRNWINHERDSTGRVRQRTGTNSGLLRKDGTALIPLGIYSRIEPFSDGLSLVYRQGPDGYGYINTSGEEVIPCQFRVAKPFKNGYAKVRQGDRYYVIDQKGAMVMETYPF
jgi:hypothetical protein